MRRGWPGRMKWRPVDDVFDLGIGTLRKKHVGNLDTAARDRNVERRAAISGEYVRVGARVEEGSSHRSPRGTRGRHTRGGSPDRLQRMNSPLPTSTAGPAA